MISLPIVPASISLLILKNLRFILAPGSRVSAVSWSRFISLSITIEVCSVVTVCNALFVVYFII